MIKSKDLPHLINLLDDPSEDIRQTILKELESFGTNLEDEIYNLDIQLDPPRKDLLESLYEKNDRIWLKKVWPSVLEIEDEFKQLETGLSYLCDYQNGRYYSRKLPHMLDHLAEEYKLFYTTSDHFQLIHFLSHQKQLKGADHDYYNPMNSNLVYVLEKGCGLPISLVSILMLTGKRLGLPFEGCNFPGHFLARFFSHEEDEMVLVDCYNNGNLIYSSDLALLDQQAFKGLISVAHEKTSSRSMLQRTIGNIANAYGKTKDKTNQELFEALLLRS